VPSLFKAAANLGQSFSMPSTDDGKLQLIKEIEYMARTLNGLSGVQPWNFTAIEVLEQELDVSRAPQYPSSTRDDASEETPKAPEGENSGETPQQEIWLTRQKHKETLW
jgi:hypothetical protein